MFVVHLRLSLLPVFLNKITHATCVLSGMRSTVRSTEPCLSWTAQWRRTRCCATKVNRRDNRGRGGGGRKPKLQQTKLPPRCRRCWWTRMRFITRCGALSAPQRWLCSIKMRFTIFLTSSPATAEMNWACSELERFGSTALLKAELRRSESSFWGSVGPVGLNHFETVYFVLNPKSLAGELKPLLDQQSGHILTVCLWKCL